MPTQEELEAGQLGIAGSEYTPTPTEDFYKTTEGTKFDVNTPDTEPTVEGGYDKYINRGPLDTNYGGKVTALQGTLGAGDTSKYVTPEATVAGQLDTLLNKDSSYMKVAEAKANEAANRRGMLSSSMAIGAGHKAAIETALPIAQQDAKTYAQSDLTLQEQIGMSALQSQKAEESMELDIQKFGLEGALNKMKAYENLKALTHQGAINFEIEKLGQAAMDRRIEFEANAKAVLEQANINSRDKQSYMDQIADLGTQYSADMGSILRDQSFATEADRRVAMNRLTAEHEKNTNFLTKAMGVNITWGSSGGSGGGSVVSTDGDTDNTTNVTDTATGTTISTVVQKPEGYLAPSGGTIEEISPEKRNVFTAAQNTPYGEVAARSYDNYDDFKVDLDSTQVKSTDEYFGLSNIEFRTVGTHSYSTGSGFSHERRTDAVYKPVNLSESEKWDTYSSIMYAALNPNNTEAQAKARASVVKPVQGGWDGNDFPSYNTGGEMPIVPYVDVNKLPPSKRSLPIYQQWVNGLYERNPEFIANNNWLDSKGGTPLAGRTTTGYYSYNDGGSGGYGGLGGISSDSESGESPN